MDETTACKKPESLALLATFTRITISHSNPLGVPLEFMEANCDLAR
jgi:hypothetical protein